MRLGFVFCGVDRRIFCVRSNNARLLKGGANDNRAQYNVRLRGVSLLAFHGSVIRSGGTKASRCVMGDQNWDLSAPNRFFQCAYQDSLIRLSIMLYVMVRRFVVYRSLNRQGSCQFFFHLVAATDRFYSTRGNFCRRFLDFARDLNGNELGLFTHLRLDRAGTKSSRVKFSGTERTGFFRRVFVKSDLSLA